MAGLRDRIGNRTSDVQGWSAEATDRALMIACAVVWLLALGFSVAAGVALAELGSARGQDAAADGGTPWLLYTVIGVSALVIALAIPLLLRARTAPVSAPGGTGSQKAARVSAARIHAGYPAPSATQPATQRLPAAVLDRLLLRCGLGVLTATGVAFAAVAIATHLMAADSVGASWAVYGVAAAITLGMIAIPVLLLRQLQATPEPESDS